MYLTVQVIPCIVFFSSFCDVTDHCCKDIKFTKYNLQHLAFLMIEDHCWPSFPGSEKLTRVEDITVQCIKYRAKQVQKFDRKTAHFSDASIV